MSATTSAFSFNEVRQFLGGILGPDLHAKRVDSLSDATLGVMHSASLAVAAIGHGLAAARGVATKHAIKQVDRLLSNPGIKVDDILALWVPYVIGARTSIAVAMDWTDFDADNQATIMLSLITGQIIVQYGAVLSVMLWAPSLVVLLLARRMFDSRTFAAGLGV